MVYKFHCDRCGYYGVEVALTAADQYLCTRSKPSCHDLGVVIEEAFGMYEMDLTDPMMRVRA